MASIQFGGGISNIVGSAGGNTFARNKGGAYMKKRANGVNPQSSKQLHKRAQMVRLAKHYTFVLSDSDRAAWVAFAATNPVVNRLGNTTFLSAQQMFLKLSGNLLTVGGTIVNTPPVSTSVPSVTLIQTIPTADPGGSLFIDVTTTTATADDTVQIWCSPAMNPGRAFISSQLRLFGSFAANVNTDVQVTYKQIFGHLPKAPGQRIFVRARVLNDLTGLTSPFMQDTTLWI